MSQDFESLHESRNPERKPRRRSMTWLLGGLVLFLLSTLVALQAFGLWSLVPPDTASDTLLLYALSSLNFISFIVFAFIFVRSLIKLRRERKERRLGSRMKTRLLVHFIGISLLPITAMAVFSYLFVNRSIEKWFFKLPDDTIVRIQHEALESQMRYLRDDAALVAVFLPNPQTPLDQSLLDNLVRNVDLAAVQVVSKEGRPIATATNPLNAEDETVLQNTLKMARESGGTNPLLSDGRDFDAVSSSLPDGRSVIIIPSRGSQQKLQNVIYGYQSEYQKLVNRQKRVRLLGLSTLGLLTLLLVFAATWIAIHLARGIALPIRALAEAANEVAKGHLSYRVSTIAEDELALLADSFNRMTAQLEENRTRIDANAAELLEKNLAIEERRNYIETVLESLTTGVISLGNGEEVTTINAAAAVMLKLDDVNHLATLRPIRLSEITSEEDHIILERLVRRARRIGRASEQTELTRGEITETEPLPVALTATALQPASSGERGVVLVMEDMTELLTAQRAAAWSEVAKRMAHEIKNPLTPIQLSAERIAKNFRRDHLAVPNASRLGNGSSESEHDRLGRIVDECTTTISREVASLKAMVDEFSRFARLPHARLEPSDLNEVIRQAVALYEDRLDGVRLDVRLARSLPTVLLDPEQMRRVFVNLVENALEALDGNDTDRRVTIATGRDPSRGIVLAEVTDTGHGIGRNDLPKLFQPYFSTRGRGTGLGLAIVQKIVSDHGGRIRAESNKLSGARFTLELPEYSLPERNGAELQTRRPETV